jgi:DNA-binding transcriptional ArsR family regulator
MKRPTDPSIEAEVFERQASICRAFAHPKRLHLLDLLANGEQRLSTMQKKLGVSRANFSQHLAILKAAGVVTTRRKGLDRYCSLALPEVKQACQLIRKVLRGQLRKQRKFSA